MYLDHCAREMPRVSGRFSHSVLSPELSLPLQPRDQISLQKPNISALESFSSDSLWGIAMSSNSEISPPPHSLSYFGFLFIFRPTQTIAHTYGAQCDNSTHGYNTQWLEKAASASLQVVFPRYFCHFFFFKCGVIGLGTADERGTRFSLTSPTGPSHLCTGTLQIPPLEFFMSHPTGSCDLWLPTVLCRARGLSFLSCDLLVPLSPPTHQPQSPLWYYSLLRRERRSL